MNLITKKSDARGALRNAGWSDKDILDVIPLASTTREPLAVGANDSMAATFQPSATPATDCTCHADAYCKIHGNTPATASEQGAGYRLAKLLRDEYWAQTPLDVAKLADEVLSQA